MTHVLDPTRCPMRARTDRHRSRPVRRRHPLRRGLPRLPARPARRRPGRRRGPGRVLGTRSIKTTAKALGHRHSRSRWSTSPRSRARTPRARSARWPPRPAAPTPPTRRCPPVAAVCVYGDLAAPPRRPCAGTASTSPPSPPPSRSGRAACAVKLADTRDAVGRRRRRDRHGHRPRRLPRRPLPRVYEEIVAVKEACGAAHLKVILETGELVTLRQRPPRLLAGDARRRRLHQDLHRQGRPRRHPASHAC